MYKTELLRVIKAAGLIPIIAGAEHAEAIVDAMDLYKAGKADSSIAQFVEDLRSALTGLKTTA